MKKVLSIAAIALMMAGSTAFACDGCGCKDKKADQKKECSKDKCGDKTCDDAKKDCSSKKDCGSKTACSK